MAERKQLEFFLLRYVPNVVRDEFVNIGLVMTESEGDGGGFADAYFLKDWERTLSLEPDTDVEMMEALGREIKSRIANAQERAVVMHEMMDRYSNVIQLSPLRQVLTEDPVREMKYLASTLVEMRATTGVAGKVEPARRPGRKALLEKMTNAFESAGVLDLMQRKVPVSMYTNPRDNFKFDFAYAVGLNLETTNIFHAVSMVGKSEDTTTFPLRVAKIVPRMAQLKKTTPFVTAIVEDTFDHNDKYVASVLAFMKDENIQIRPVREMATIAANASRDLRA